MASETTTPNVGFQIPAFNQPNWQVPINFNWNKLDKIFNGEIQIPGLSVLNFIITGIGIQIAASMVPEVPTGVIPGNVYTCSFTPTAFFGFYLNGLLQQPGVDYTRSGAVITMINGNATVGGDKVYAVYLK